ncbi:MAG: glutathione S-transferase family protein [Alphaproteobacteria bacterium]|nr:glutathione S-transferase family protein [Alphaproteobacteria bacterium]
MAITLYDLVGADARCFSPFCWRVRWALAHKGLTYERAVTRFTEIGDIGDGSFKTVPVIDDGGTWVGGSFDIALYLEEKYADEPSLFGSHPTLARFIENWVQTQIHPRLVRLVVNDIHDHLTPEDQAYFTTSREKRFGMKLADVQADRDDRIDDLRAAFQPLRATVEAHDFLGGDRPYFADYLAAGPLQWARVISQFQILEADDPVAAWFGRIVDLYDGMAREAPGYPLAA